MLHFYSKSSLSVFLFPVRHLWFMKTGNSRKVQCTVDSVIAVNSFPCFPFKMKTLIEWCLSTAWKERDRKVCMPLSLTSAPVILSHQRKPITTAESFDIGINVITVFSPSKMEFVRCWISFRSQTQSVWRVGNETQQSKFERSKRSNYKLLYLTNWTFKNKCHVLVGLKRVPQITCFKINVEDTTWQITSPWQS